jgi:hypothetical protein
MVTTTSTPFQTLSGEQRVVFHNVNWANYRQISQLLPQNRHSRLSYESGTLEITMPLEDHEFFLARRLEARATMIQNFVLTRLHVAIESEGYQEYDRSPTFPLMKTEDLYDFLNESSQDEGLATIQQYLTDSRF